MPPSAAHSPCPTDAVRMVSPPGIAPMPGGETALGQMDEGPGTVTAAPFDGSVAVIPRSRLGDYATLCKVRLNLLVLITTAVGYKLAASANASWVGFVHVLIGTGLTAAASAVLNQWIEVERDRLMPRTRNRPLPAGRVTSNEALALGATLAVAGLSYLWLFTPTATFLLGLVTLLSYLVVYTPLKTRSTLNTLVGAVPGAMPPVMGYTAAGGGLDAVAAALFGMLFFWQIPHFLAIATLYREDYRVGGYRMLPCDDPDLLATARQVVLHCLLLLAVSVLPPLLGVAGPVYLVAATVLGTLFLAAAVAFAWHRTRRDARTLFFASIAYLPLLLVALVLGSR